MMLSVKKISVNPDIKYRRMLNKLNLEIREKIATEEMFYPFETEEKKQIMQDIETWKRKQQACIYNQCYNTKPSFLQKFLKIFNHN